MKKGIKITAAAALAVSALTPVAAFAAENTLESGYYTEDGFTSVKEFAGYTPSAKKAFIKANLPKKYFVFVLDNKQVLDLKGDNFDEIITALTDEELVSYSGSLEQYQEKNEVEITSTGVVKETEVAGELKVESVSAINAEEVLVTFNQEVDATTASNVANYELWVNGTAVTSAFGDVSVDGKTAILRLATGKTPFKVGDKYSVQVKDSVLDKNGKKVERFTTETLSYNLAVAPKLVGVELDSANNELLVEFDRPIDTGVVQLIKLDGISLSAPSITANSTDAGDYVYTVTLATSAEQTLAAKQGKRTLDIFTVTETASANPVSTSSVTGSYTVAVDEAAPQVTNVVAIDSNKFFVEFNKEADLDAVTSLVVTKGNHEFTTTSISAATVTADSTVYAIKDTYKTKHGYFVAIADDADGTPDENPLYKGSETSATLKVTVKDYQESAPTNLRGEEVTKTVTLTKSAVAPTIKSASIDGSTNEFTVVFDGTLKAAPAATDIIVRDKAGVIIAVAAAPALASDGTGINNAVEFALSPAAASTSAPYTVEFKANTVQFAGTTTSAKVYKVDGPKNSTKLTTKADYAGNSAFKYVDFATLSATIDDTTTPNVVMIDFGTDMDASAINPSNYLLDGKALPANTSIDFVGDTQNVHITFPEGTLPATTDYLLTIKSDVKTKANEHIVKDVTTKVAYSDTVALVDNVKPTLTSAKYINIASGLTDEIELTFSEAIDTIASATAAGILDDLLVQVVGTNQTIISVDNHATDSNKLVVTLGADVNTTQRATVQLVSKSTTNSTILILDAEGNEYQVTPAVSITK